VKPDEQMLLDWMQTAVKLGDTPYVREFCAYAGLNQKRAAYICEKWVDKGWYDYGVNVLAGWLTEKGMEVVQNPPSRTFEELIATKEGRAEMIELLIDRVVNVNPNDLLDNH